MAREDPERTVTDAVSRLRPIEDLETEAPELKEPRIVLLSARRDLRRRDPAAAGFDQ
jgi:hypothetical protein